MAITPGVPNTVHLGGPKTEIMDLVAIETITPGMVLEYHNDSGALKWGVHDSADTAVAAFVAIEQTERNKGVDDTYAAGDLMKVYHLAPGATFWAIIPSGQNLAPGALLQSNGDGKLKAVGSGVAKFVALEAKNVTEDTRIRVEVL
jgi:hypothetical protein